MKLGLSAARLPGVRARGQDAGPPPTVAGTSCPHDVATLAEPVLGHRLLLDAQAQFSGVQVADVVAGLLEQVRAAGRPDR